MTVGDCIWVIDDDKSIRWVLEKALGKAGLEVTSFPDGRDILERLAVESPKVIISDIRMPGIDGISLLEQIDDKYPGIPVIIMTAHSDLDSALSAYKGGAFEYLPKPFDVNVATDLIRRAVQFYDEQAEAGTVDRQEATAEIIGKAPAMQEVFRAIGRLSRSNITVLINGESGTGKELVAQALHRHSPRMKEAFIALNTAAIPRDLLESELFGHEKGAFTGAQSSRKGRFEQADGGTLFLDEIGDMPAELQTRLLRVLADGEFYRVGGHTPVRVDVRIIAATHQNLEERVEDGSFREDLFHRLNVIRIHVPSVRERIDDIPLLCNHFLQKVAVELNVEPKIIRPEVYEYLMMQDWRGNVRQLENTCRWLTVMASGREILIEDLPPELATKTETAGNRMEDWDSVLRRWADKSLSEGEVDLLDKAMPRFERVMIEVALKHTNGRKQDAAKLLGWGRNTLTRKIKELNME
ncbi:MAG TPA: nitrogen regulation protein NR(I) [Gammaproteobacteria bacterium]|nr:nitrogen regulation protein NR(I) [Gammaproteobacteria bacterium]